MAFPIGQLEWKPSQAVGHAARIKTISTNGASDVSFNSNYHIVRYNAFDTIDLAGTEWQVCAFWNSNLNLVIGKRSNGGSWSLYVYDGTGGLATIVRSENDNHNNCNIALDSTGIIHVAYDHHNTSLNYRKSTVSVSSFTGALGSEISMLGTNESAVAYPTFFRDPQDRLYFMFRDGGSGAGDLFMYLYDAGAGTWSGASGTTAGKAIDGKNSSPDENPYWHGQPHFTSDWDGAGVGFMYLGWAWRETSDSETMHDVSIVRWNGTTWTHSDGGAQTMPITHENCEIVNAVGQNNSLASFNSMCLDGDDNPHLFQNYDDAADSDRSKIWHTYFNGSTWSTSAITPSDGSVDYGLNGVDCVIDADDTIHVIACHPAGIGDGIYVWTAAAPWTSWSMSALTNRDTTIVEGNPPFVTNVAGQHDRYQWEVNGIYHMMVPLLGEWAETEDDFTAWEGWLEATPDAPSETLGSLTLKVAIDNDAAHADFWAAVRSDGADIRLADENGQQFPYDLIEWDYAGQFALIAYMHYGDLDGTQTVRIYAGKADATAPGDDDAFGRHAAYEDAMRGYWPHGGGTDRTSHDNDFTMTGAPTLNAGVGPMGQSAYEFDGSTQYGLANASVPTAAPWTFVARGRSDSATAAQVMLSLAAQTSNVEHVSIDMRGDQSGDPVWFSVRSDTANTAAAAGYAPDVWRHVAGVAKSALARSAYSNGVAGTENTGERIPLSISRIGVGVLARGLLDARFDGELCDVQLYDRELSAVAVAYDSAMGDQAAFWNGWVWNLTPPLHVLTRRRHSRNTLLRM